jgi:TnpA family transposase
MVALLIRCSDLSDLRRLETSRKAAAVSAAARIALGFSPERAIGDPGVKFYTHLSDQFGPFHTKVIAARAQYGKHTAQEY